MSASATVRIQGSSAADQSVVLYDSTAQTIYSGADYAKSFTILPARYWRISIVDTGNSYGYIEIGRIFIGATFRPINNIDYSPNYSIESATGVATSLGGTEYFDRRPNKRVWQGKFSWLTQGEAESFNFGQRIMDIAGEVFLIADDTDTAYRDSRNFLGRLRQLSAIENPYLNQYSMSLEIQELL
jgi:hypothetical protein